MGIGLVVGSGVGSNGCSIVIMGVYSGKVFRFKIWERKVGCICGGLIVVFTGIVVVVVSERVGTVVVIVDSIIVGSGIGVVTETVGCFEIGVVMFPKGM